MTANDNQMPGASVTRRMWLPWHAKAPVEVKIALHPGEAAAAPYRAAKIVFRDEGLCGIGVPCCIIRMSIIAVL
jgi:hypothetical protein